MNFKKLSAVLLACAAFVAAGCNNGPKKPADLPDLHPTVIKVAYDDGTPVPNVQVALVSQASGGRTWNINGTTDATGAVTLKTDGNWDGVPAGTYAVVVNGSIEETNESGEVVSITRIVAEKYANPRGTELTATVTEGSNEIEVKVGEKIEESVKMM